MVSFEVGPKKIVTVRIAKGPAFDPKRAFI
jgi:hypothetical protein